MVSESGRAEEIDRGMKSWSWEVKIVSRRGCVFSVAGKKSCGRPRSVFSFFQTSVFAKFSANPPPSSLLPPWRGQLLLPTCGALSAGVEWKIIDCNFKRSLKSSSRTGQLLSVGSYPTYRWMMLAEFKASRWRMEQKWALPCSLVLEEKGKRPGFCHSESNIFKRNKIISTKKNES